MEILNNSIVGTILAIMLIYALLSILVSLLLEGANQFLKSRAKNLKKSIETMIDGQEGSTLAEAFYNHYMVNGQIKGSKNADDKPINSISDDLFAEAFTDILTQLTGDKDDNETKTGQKEVKRMDLIKAGIEKISDNAPLKELLLSFCFKAQDDYEKFEKHLKEWYNEFMTRVSGWYKKAQRWKLFIAGLLVAVTLNVDSIFLFNVISKNDNLRNELEKVADNVATNWSQLDSIKKEDPSQLLKTVQSGVNQIIDSTKTRKDIVDPQKLDSYIKKLEAIAGKLDSIEQIKYSQTKEALALVSDLSIPIGWDSNRAPLSWFKSKEDKKAMASDLKTEDQTALKEYVNKRNLGNGFSVPLYIIGILITAFSLSFGAPFWFEMLAKLVNLRRLGKTSTSSKKE